jgi:hypothetical protein
MIDLQDRDPCLKRCVLGVIVVAGWARSQKPTHLIPRTGRRLFRNLRSELGPRAPGD